MLYAKMLQISKANLSHASERYTVVCGHKIEFIYDAAGRPFLHVTYERGHDRFPVYGDVFVMSESGKTISEFAPPLRYLGVDAEGWNTVPGQCDHAGEAPPALVD